MQRRSVIPLILTIGMQLRKDIGIQADMGSNRCHCVCYIALAFMFLVIWVISVQVIQIFLSMLVLLLGLLRYAYSQNIKKFYRSGIIILIGAMISIIFSTEIALFRFHVIHRYYQNYIESHATELAKESDTPWNIS